MTAKTADASAAYENPLIPNARLRQIYLAMVQARMLEKALPAGRRARAVPPTGSKSSANNSAKGHALGLAGLEACLVSASIDLGAGDLVSDAVGGGTVEYLRGAAVKAVLGARVGKSKGPAVCGGAVALPPEAGEARLWLAMGAAAPLKSAAVQARSVAAADVTADGSAVPHHVVVAYVRPGEMTAAAWRRALKFAAAEVLPVVFVVMPAARGAAAAGAVSALARGCGVPGIAVDGDDAVAIYRVAQESIGRARAGGGAALMECVPYVLPGANAKTAGDALAGMERYLLQRGVVTKAWMEREALSFGRLVGAK